MSIKAWVFLISSILGTVALAAGGIKFWISFSNLTGIIAKRRSDENAIKARLRALRNEIITGSWPAWNGLAEWRGWVNGAVSSAQLSVVQKEVLTSVVDAVYAGLIDDLNSVQLDNGYALLLMSVMFQQR